MEENENKREGVVSLQRSIYNVGGKDMFGKDVLVRVDCTRGIGEAPMSCHGVARIEKDIAVDKRTSLGFDGCRAPFVAICYFLYRSWLLGLSDAAAATMLSTGW